MKVYEWYQHLKIADVMEVFFDSSKKDIHSEFIPKSKTVNKEFFLLGIHYLRRFIPQKWPQT